MSLIIKVLHLDMNKFIFLLLDIQFTLTKSLPVIPYPMPNSSGLGSNIFLIQTFPELSDSDNGSL